MHDVAPFIAGGVVLYSIGFIAGTIWGSRGYNNLLADYEDLHKQLEYPVPRDSSGRFTKRENR